MRKLLMLLGILIAAFQLSAQTRIIIGKVTDESGNPLEGATVRVANTNRATLTKSDGTFSLQVPTNAKTLVVSYVGSGDQNVALGSGNVYNIALKRSGDALDEVVVTGYQARKKRDDAGAISTVRAAQLENLPNPSLDKALQGRAAGVMVQSSNGIPGGAISVRIRGIGSISAGNEPLYIVDGVPINTRDDASFTQSNPLAYLNPDDIESIDILKDAASAAIYGSGAANGVVLVTTKKGKAGKTKITFNTYVGKSSPLKLFNMVNSQEYFQLRSEAYAFPGNLDPKSLSVKKTVLNELRIPNILTDASADSAIAALQTYDWQAAAFRNGNIQSYELSASGGNDRTTFRVSASHQLQEAIVTKADFRRDAFKMDVTNRVTNKLNLSSSLAISSVYQTNPFAVSGSFLGSPAFAAAGILPVNPIYNADGSYANIPPSSEIGTLNQNLIAVNDFNSGYQRNNQLVGNFRFDYRFTDWLIWSGQAGLDYRLGQGKRVLDARTPDAFARKGLVTTTSTWNTNTTAFTTLNFNKTFNGIHRVTALAGYEFRRDYQNSLSESGDGFPTYQFTYLNNAANPVSVGEFFSGYRKNSFFGKVDYNYNRKYQVSYTVRYDGSSRFGIENKYGLFQGGEFLWNVDQESFLKGNKTLSALKLRLGLGQTGNDQIDNFASLGLFGGGGVYNGAAGIAYTQLAVPNLKWETSTTTNLGVDFGLFANRITGSIELYTKKNTNLLLGQPLQLTTGFSSITTNVGAMSNKGIEVTLGADIFKANREGAFNWNTNFVFSYNKNKVTDLYGGLTILPGDNSIQVGQPVGVLFTQKFAGVNPATGRPMWYDTLGNLTYQVQAKDRVLLGNTRIPTINGGWDNTFSFKNFTLNVFFNYQYGQWTSDGQVNFLIENIARINELHDVYDNRWTTPGQITWFPRFNTAGTESKGSGAQSGNRTFFKTDMIRLKNVTLSYNLSQSLLKRWKIDNLKVYVQGTNLYTMSDWFSYDVEYTGGAGGSTGIIPTSKNYTIGLQVGL